MCQQGVGYDPNSVQQWAEQLGAGCFLNALVREWDGWSWVPAEAVSEINSEARAAISIPVKNTRDVIYICLQHQSVCGRHRFLFPFLLGNRKQQIKRTLTFPELVQILSESQSLWPVDEQARSIFLSRVSSSIENTATALRERRADLSDIYSSVTRFQDSEQSLLAGHSVHPTPKSRDQMTAGDARRFVPEFGRGFRLHWFTVDSTLLEADSVHEKSFDELTRQLAQEDPQLDDRIISEIPSGHTLLPAHPWQAEQWLATPWFQQLLAEGRLIDCGVYGSEWRATSSVRAVYAPHASFMLKYSLSVRLTNSMRHLLPKEVIRGKEIHQVKYQTEVGKEFRANYPDFDILTEPAHAAIKGPNGEVLPETMMVFRENPFSCEEICNDTELMAVLTQDNPCGEPRVINRVQQLAAKEGVAVSTVADKWFHEYLRAVVEPLMMAQSNYGLLFGAHQQNILINLKDGYPRKAWFRDCQGTGYSHVARSLLGNDKQDAEDNPEHHVEANLGNRLFTYYLIINSTFGLISALGSDPAIGEQRLLHRFRLFLEKLRDSRPRDASCLEYILDSPELWSKGNFYCAFNNLNENTLNDPLAIYHAMKNPLLQSA
ncbi:IucA/IucC family protein [Endozoicomonadaceae bacterium StTr2]